MSNRAGISMADEKTAQDDDRRTLIDSDVQDPTSHTMTQDQNCPFTRTMNTFFEKVERIEHPESLVNYGLILMLPLLMVSVWLSS
ncbi:hypothetical protein OIU74_024228 [Salix koriyanagi]|uniref:Uncharacterized protein n=1 Tax=Salix koriyanagi TaxID=2511006 RepID=A0A9Q1A7X1_9ROSI|nr:hypothetical protein OIU74_024228 [Salix koriyanagi]